MFSCERTSQQPIRKRDHNSEVRATVRMRACVPAETDRHNIVQKEHSRRNERFTSNKQTMTNEAAKQHADCIIRRCCTMCLNGDSSVLIFLIVFALMAFIALHSRMPVCTANGYRRRF
jgi:hypothetical protein